MSHGDSVTAAPDRLPGAGRHATTPVAAFEDVDRGLAGVQWHPEVLHTEHGQQVLEHFLLDIAGCRPTWTMVNIVEEQIESIRAQIGERGQAICGLTGGVDSAVAAALVQQAIGERLTCVYVDHGLMRQDETDQVERDFVAATGVDLVVVDAEKQFLDALAGVSDPEAKRKVIGREFIRVFEAAEADILGAAAADGDDRGLPGAGHPLPRRGRVRGRGRHVDDQVPPQRGRPARRPGVRARRAAAHPVQGRGPSGRRSSWACPPRSSGGSRSRARAWASGSSGR